MFDANAAKSKPTNYEGTYGDLLVLPRANQAPQLTLSIYDADSLAKLQADLRGLPVNQDQVNQTNILLTAIMMTQACAMKLDINTFMAALYTVVPPAERKLIKVALRELINWVGTNIPTSDLEVIFDSCHR